MRRLLAALILACGPALAADAPADKYADLVQKLGDARFADRTAAGQALAAAGAAAVPALTAARDASTDPEIQARAAVLLDLIRRRDESAKLTATKLVKLDYRGVPLAQVVADLKAKTGIPLEFAAGKVADPARTVTVTTPIDVPAWVAVDELCKAAGLTEIFRPELPPAGNSSTSYYGRRSYMVEGNQQAVNAGAVPVQLADGKFDPPAGSRATGVRVLALPGRFPTNRIIRGSGRVELTLDVTPLPGLNWQEVSTVRITRAEDETGRPMFADMKPLVDSPYYGGGDYGWGGNGRFWGGGVVFFDDSGNNTGPRAAANPRLVAVPLRTDDRVVKKLTRFEGVVVGEVNIVNVPVITIDNLAAAAGKPAIVGPNEMKVAITKHAGASGKTTVGVRVETLQAWVIQQMKRGQNPNQMMFWGGWSDSSGNVASQLSFFDAAGKPCPNPSLRQQSFSSDGMRQTADIEFEFAKSDKSGPPVKVVVRGTKSATVEVPFAAVNVALP